MSNVPIREKLDEIREKADRAATASVSGEDILPDEVFADISVGIQNVIDILPVVNEPEVDCNARKKLTETRPSVTVKVKHGQMKGYVIVGFYQDTETPAEVFIKIAKEGSTLRSMLDMWARFASYLLQHGVQVTWMLEVIKNHRFDPYSTFEVGEGPTKGEGTIFDAVACAIAEACDHYGDGTNGVT